MRILSILTILAAIALPAAAQHQVFLIGTTFQDSVSGTNVTTITIGDTIEWIHVSGGFHTVTSGTGSADPNSGALFDQPMNPGDTFQYTPVDCGVIPYYCIPHEAFLMVGTIIINPAPPTYPGSGEDFEMGSAINGANVTFGGCLDVKQANAGDFLTLVARSPNGTFDNHIILLAADIFPTGGTPPIGSLGLSVGTTTAFIVVNGFDGGAGGLQQVVTPNTGSAYTFILPPGLAGQTLLFQFIAWAPGMASNGFFAVPDAHAIEMQT